MACTRRKDAELREKFVARIKTTTDPVGLIRAHCFAHGITGLKSLTRAFLKADKDGSGALDLKEFRRVLIRSGLGLDEKVIRKAFDQVDSNHDGRVSLEEAMTALRPSIASHRLELIQRVFLKLDKDKSGYITLDDLRGVYNAKNHPKYLNGELSEEQVTKEFIKTFDATKDGKISEEEFRDYYIALSASIDNDAYFDLIMRQAWGL